MNGIAAYLRLGKVKAEFIPQETNVQNIYGKRVWNNKNFNRGDDF